MTFLSHPADARPREKLLARGPESLADTELLAILLRTGVKGQPVLALARNLLDRFNGLAGLLRASPEALSQVHGLGPSKQATLAAVMELARRGLREDLAEQHVFQSVDAVRTFLRLHLDALPHECFAVMFLDIRHRLIRLDNMFRGTLSHTIAYPREVVKRALALEAGAVILAHNHPSGVAEPSEADISLTRAMKQALALVDVPVLDHFVVGAGNAVSMAELGML
ncbi:DNA replication and repair protein RadC [Roseateles sp. YR242]|uniref:RadC family protein n=1 Tax=Roseateles sp. YR242 TaxID=1855305 RepID=UPI0008D7A6A1|nr:DNA repair protein RadC [Roseateles sp. YR242]SEK38768.1 DNA replication and repair protein RadC [Roseateles sp. YR242]